MSKYARIAAVMLIALVARGCAQEAAPSDFALTIYSTADPAHFDPQTAAQNQMDPNSPVYQQPLPGYGVVREVRKVTLAAGENTVPFSDVAAGIDPTTVAFKSLTAPDTTTVLEQNYEFDLVSPDKLLQKYLGKEIIINRKQTPLPDDKTRQPETIQGKLLTYDQSMFVIQTDNLRLPVQMVPRGKDISEIKLFNLETGLITKPTLLWKIQAQKAGAHDVQVTYQTDGLTWRADYNLVVNKADSGADLSAWVSILNQSGISYPNAKLKLVAGDVQRMERGQSQGVTSPLGGSAGATAPPGFTEKSFFDYHLYTLGRPASLANNSTKQIELFPARAAIPVQKIYVYCAGAPSLDRFNPSSPIQEESVDIGGSKKVDIFLQIDNTQKNGLGIALPAGRVRVYKKDEADAANEFIGEDVIQHTPPDEKIRARLGSAFDIVGERRQTDFEVKNERHLMEESFEIVLRNHKKEAVHVLVREELYRWRAWEITTKSDNFEKVDARTIQFPVDVGADGEKKVTYTVKYTW